jgi:hypothetical protein
VRGADSAISILQSSYVGRKSGRSVYSLWIEAVIDERSSDVGR